ncbi:hypothetical protein KC335_g19094 [Hortaea werneckii]|nr:hypothetical protein KC335_g19094 [Hortaea werneckii]
MPQNPQAAWLGARGGGVGFRPRLMLAGPRFFLTDNAERQLYGGNAFEQPQRERRRRNNQNQEGNANGGRSWLDRLPNMNAVGGPRFFRRQQPQNNTSQHGPVEEIAPTPGDLEAGTRR